MNVLLTGATGFVGRRLVDCLLNKTSVDLTAAVRSHSVPEHVPFVMVDDLDWDTDWSAALRNQQVVVHAAGRAHIMKDLASDPLAEYRRINVGGTLNLARQAAKAGIRRFVFISTIGVNGNINTCPFTEDDLPNPVEPYAQSKWEAEQGLWDIQKATGMELVVLRPPLAYGYNAPGNFGNLIRWVEKGIPLPFGAIHNQRSLVALDNLVDLITLCINHPAAANQTFLVSDGHDLSTTELLIGVASTMGKPSRLLPIPAGILMLCARFLGKKALAQRLLGSLQVDISKSRTLLGWEPPVSVKEGLQRCFDKKNN